MFRVLFHWRGIPVYSYAAMLYLGLIFGVVAENYAAHLRGLNSGRVFVATLLLLVPALVGARGLFVAAHWEIYRREPWRIWRRSEGGSKLYGGLLLSWLVSLPLLSGLQVPLGAFWDVATLTGLIGMIFARLGCLLNGCCAGRPTEKYFALWLPNNHGIWTRRVPTPLLEASWGILLLVGFLAIWNRMPFAGGLFLYALVGYCTGRFVLQFTREQRNGARKITIDHAISAALVAIVLTIFLVTWPW